MTKIPEEQLELTLVTQPDALPTWTTRAEVVRFFHETMKPYEDTPEDIDRALDYAFSASPGKGGYLHLLRWRERMVGALLMLHTGMGGYVPANLLLFVTVDSELRGRGVGRVLVERSIAICNGPVKLHVEYDNPAKRLYERIGFTTKYAEMRYVR